MSSVPLHQRVPSGSFSLTPSSSAAPVPIHNPAGNPILFDSGSETSTSWRRAGHSPSVQVVLSARPNLTAPQSAVCMRPSRGGLWVYYASSIVVWQAIYHVSGHMANGVPSSSTPCLVFKSSRWDDLVGKLSSASVLLALRYCTLCPCSHYTCSELKRACRGHQETIFFHTRDCGTLEITY